MKNTILFLALLSLTFLLGACSSGPICASDKEVRPGNFLTGQEQADATIGTLCVDKAEYNTGDTVHMTFTVKNALNEQIVLDGGQQPVVDICPAQHQCLSQYQSDVAQLTHLVLEPGQSHTIQWDWPSNPSVSPQDALGPTNEVSVRGYWVRLDRGRGQVYVMFLYGLRKGPPL
jgi:hypothetical protein